MTDDKPLSFLELANRQVASERLARQPVRLKAVLDVFDDPSPDERFIEFARAYIGKPGHDVRVSAINDLKWAFGVADRTALTRLLRWKGIIGPKD